MVPDETLRQVFREASTVGWATFRGTAIDIQRFATFNSLTSMKVREGETTPAVLKPTTTSDARPHSLSAQYGKGPQPLHTDGAHLKRPPDVVVLFAKSPSDIATKLWRPTAPGRRYNFPDDDWRNGIFMVKNGASSFFATSVGVGGGYRFDPGCMVPCDSRARRVRGYLDDALLDAATFEWRDADTVLVIHNRRTLHARCSAEAESSRVLERYTYWEGQS